MNVTHILIVAAIVCIALPAALARWASAVPPLGRWLHRHFPRVARLLGYEEREQRMEAVEEAFAAPARDAVESRPARDAAEAAPAEAAGAFGAEDGRGDAAKDAFGHRPA